MKKLPRVLLIVVFLLIIASGFYYMKHLRPTNIKGPSDFSSSQIKQIEKITHDYLLNNPKILLEVNKKLREQDQEKQKERIEKIEKNIPKYKKEIFDTQKPGRLVLGNPQGKIIITEFTQHQCPMCKRSALIIEELVKNNPDIKLIVIYWPFFGEDATHTAKAVFAAKKQNKAQELNKAFFAHQESVTKNKAEGLIKSIPNLDHQKLVTDMADKKFDKGLQDNFKLAQKLGLIGTPAFIFTNKKMTKFSLIPGQTAHFKQDIEKALSEVR